VVVGPALLPRARFAALRNVALGLAASLGLIVAILFVAGASTTLPRLLSLFSLESYGARLEAWQASLDAWRSSPFLGLGLGSFEVAVAPYFRHDRGVSFTRAENEYLDVLVEAGLIGLGLSVAFLVWILWLGARALRDARAPRDRAAVLGALFGVTAVSVQALGDFCLHIPGIAVPVLIASASLARVGSRAESKVAEGVVAAQRHTVRRVSFAGLVPAVGAVVVAVAATAHDFRLAKAEALLADARPAAAGSTGVVPEEAIGALAAEKERIEAALRQRPDWTEGHLRRGLMLLALYQQTAAEWVRATEPDPKRVAIMSDPLWLLGVAHSAGDGGRLSAGDLLKHEPIRQYLVPAARSFLEARRCSPYVALTHARIASLDFLLRSSDPPSVYLRRARSLAGAQSRVLDLIAQVAVQVDDLDMAERCWHDWLEIDPAAWEEVAVNAGATLTPEQILGHVLPGSARQAVLFAEHLYASDDQAPAREQFMRVALDHLPGEELSEAERLQLEARARAGLGDCDLARERMEAALELEPLRRVWRKALVRWSLAWGDWDRARTHALAGLRTGPEDVDLRFAVESATEALARGRPSEGRSFRAAGHEGFRVIRDP
jgi:hypothetical protein